MSPGCRAGRLPGTREETRAARPGPAPPRARSRRSSGAGSRERVRALGADRSQKFLDLSGTDQVDRPSVAEARVDSEEPRAGGRRLVETQEVRPDELEQVDLLRVRGVDARTLQPPGYARAA